MIRRLLESKWRFRQLLVALVLVILVLPAIAEFTGRDTTALGLTIVVLGVLLASGHRNCRIAFSFATFVLALVWYCTLVASNFRGFHYLGVAGLLFFSIKIAVDYLRRQTRIDQESLAAAAAVYLLFGLALGAIYAAITYWIPDSIRFGPAFGELNLHDHVYFSFVVLTTIGFGDVSPASPLTQSLAILQGIAGLFFLAIVISRLVSLYKIPNNE